MFFLLTAHKPVFINSNNCKQTCRITCTSFCMSFPDLLFPRTCAIPLQTLIVNEYALVNHRFSFSNYGLFFVYIHHKITKFDINLFFIYLVMLAKYVSSFQHRKNAVKYYINTFNFRGKNPNNDN